MPSLAENFQSSIGIHSLDLLNENNSNVATISSSTNSSFIKFYTNLNPNNYFTIGSCNSSFIIRENTNPIGGIVYKNNELNIDNIKNYTISLDSINYNTSQVFYPNNKTDISSYNFATSGFSTINYSSNVFDLSSNTFWQSESLFTAGGVLIMGSAPTFTNILIEDNYPDGFIKGVWVTITLPESILLTNIVITALITEPESGPGHFLLYGYDYVLGKWKVLIENSYYNYSTNNNVYLNIPANKQSLYDKFTFMVTQVQGKEYTKVASIRFIGKPIIKINNLIKISEDNIYNINTISAKELRLNNNSITTFDNLINTISAGAIQTVSSNITLNWSNNAIATKTFAFKNVGIYDANPNSTLSINGDITYKNRVLDNRISIYPHPELIIGSTTIPSQYYTYSYITLGKLNFYSNDYFNFDIYSIDFPINSTDYPYTSYLQKISVYGIANSSLNSIYFDNEINITYLPTDLTHNKKIERITNISYYYTNNNTIEFYVKYNDLLNITNTITPKNFSNIIYVDFLNTKTNSNNNFILNTSINYPSTGFTPINAIKNSERIIDLSIVNSNTYNNYCKFYSDSINTNSLYFTNNNYSSNKILYTDVNGIVKSTSVSKTQIERLNIISSSSNYILFTNNEGLITASSISSAILYGLSNINNSSNKVILSDNKGILTYSPVSDTQLEGLYNISFSSNKVLLTNSSGLITYSSVTNNQLLGLSNVSISSNKVLLTDEKGLLTYGNVTNTQLNGLYNISFSSNKILSTDNNGIINYTPVSYDMLIGLSNIKSKPKRFIVTDENGYISTTDITSSNAEGLNNILTLFNFSQNIAYTYSNIIIGTNVNIDNSQLYVKGKIQTNNINLDNYLTIGQGIFSWNSNINALQYNNLNNWKQFSDDIFRCVSKYPPTFLYSDPFTTDVPKNQNIYNSYLNNTGSYGNGIYIIKTDRQDNGISNKNINKIFSDDTENYYWKTYPNFNTTISGYISTKYIEANATKYPNTFNGAYFIITLPEKILLTYYNIYYNYTSTSEYGYRNTIKSFKLFGYNSSADYWDILDTQTNITNWNNNFTPNTFTINDVYNNKRYDTFAICILKTNTDTNNNYAVINGFELYGINNYYGNIIYNISSTTSITSNIYNNNSNIYTKAYQSSPTLILGNNKVGINNYLPSTYLSIGSDIYTSNNNINYEPIINLNHSCNVDNANIGIKVLNLTRPSNNITHGIRVSHVLDTWVNNFDNLRTRYDINLSDKKYENENMVVSMLSDGRVGIGMTPDTSNYRQPNLSVLSNIYLYNNKDANTNYNKNFVSIGVHNISSNYGLILPSGIGSLNNFLNISAIYNNPVNEGNRLITGKLDWTAPNDIFNNITFAKIGYQNVISCNINPIKLQVAGSCIIGSNLINTISRNFINNNTLIVTGRIYCTHDVTTDSDKSYKYNLLKIDNPIDKILKLNGYTFNRNDTLNDDNRRYCGLIAQEVEKVLPEAVMVKHDNKLRLFYNNLAGLFVEGIKEHDDIITKMDIKINMLIICFICYIYYNHFW